VKSSLPLTSIIPFLPESGHLNILKSTVMKNYMIPLAVLAGLFVIAFVYNVRLDKDIKTANPRDQMFSTLVTDETYRNEFMEIMQAKYPEAILASAFAITETNRPLQGEMVNQMAALCYSDAHMSKMMMGMTMNMCDIDKDRCSMMSNMMINHRPTMTCMLRMMQEKGMITKECKEHAVTFMDNALLRTESTATNP
jgi:hypothetical protein